jgi:hypothetical protein
MLVCTSTTWELAEKKVDQAIDPGNKEVQIENKRKKEYEVHDIAGGAPYAGARRQRRTSGHHLNVVKSCYFAGFTLSDDELAADVKRDANSRPR